jgi:valyl-tRNA synthetase
MNQHLRDSFQVLRNELMHSVVLARSTADLRKMIEYFANVRLEAVATVANALPQTARLAQLSGGGVAIELDEGEIAVERERLSRQLLEAEGEVNRLEQKLGNEQFRSKAPAQVVAREGEKLAAARSRTEGLRARLEELASQASGR